MAWEKIKKKSKDALQRIKPKDMSKEKYAEIDPGKLPDASKYIYREDRTHANEIVRKGLTTGLISVGDALKEVHAKFIELQLLNAWTQMDELITLIENFYEEVMNPDYGFSTYFETRKIEDIDFKFVRELEHNLLTELKALEENVIAFKNKILSENFVEAGIEHLKLFAGKLKELQELYNDRKKLISSYEKLAV